MRTPFFLTSLFAFLAPFVCCHTHWAVNENGRIEENIDTLFNMADPQDLHQFYKQDDLIKKFDAERENIFEQKEIITFHELKDDPLIEEKLMSNDEDCINAGRNLEKQNLFVSALDPIDRNDNEWARLISSSKNLKNRAKSKFSVCPDLRRMPKNLRIFNLYESVYERIDRITLKSTPEDILHLLNIEEFSTPGALSEFLSKIFDQGKDQEWTAYTLASYYFRAIGEPSKGAECLKFALYLSPNNYFGVPVLSLVNILHQSGRGSDAQTVLERSIPSEPTNLQHFYFMLGQVYAVSFQHRTSIWAFEKCLSIDPTYESARLHASILKCHTKLEKALESQHENLQITLSQLDTYKKRMDTIQKLQADVVANIVDPRSKMQSDLLYDEIVLGPLKGVICDRVLQKGKRMDCDIYDYQAYKKHKKEILQEKEKRRKRKNENDTKMVDDEDNILFTTAKP